MYDLISYVNYFSILFNDNSEHAAYFYWATLYTTWAYTGWPKM